MSTKCQALIHFLSRHTTNKLVRASGPLGAALTRSPKCCPQRCHPIISEKCSGKTCVSEGKEDVKQLLHKVSYVIRKDGAGCRDMTQRLRLVLYDVRPAQR